MEMICRSERICRNGRIAYFWKYMVPEEFSDAAAAFDKSMRELSTEEFEFPVRGEMIFRDGLIFVVVKAGERALISESFKI